MIIVIDTSAGADLILQGKHSKKIRKLLDEYYDISDFSIECLNEALRLDHSTYDMLYVTLAKRSGGVLLTIDKKLSKLAANEGIDTPILEDSA